MKTQSTTPSEIEVSSRLEMWWLVWVRGYRVKKRSQAPKLQLFGRILYKTTWFLRA